MKIEQLIYFVETAKQEHIGRASKILGISPSAVSHSIRSLEGELSLKLFQKKGKFIVLTNEGKKLLNKSEDLITSFQNLKYDLLEESNDVAYIKIGASHTLSSELVAPLWGKLAKRYNKTKIDLLTLRSADIAKGILEKQFDIGLIFSPQDHPGIEKNVLYVGQMYLVVRKGHPILNKRGVKKVQGLSSYPAVLPKAFQGIDVCLQNPMFEKHNIIPNPETLTDSYDIALKLISSSDYWGLIPDIILDLRPGDYEIIKPKSGWDAKFSISMIWSKRSFIPKIFTDLKDELKLFLS